MPVDVCKYLVPHVIKGNLRPLVRAFDVGDKGWGTTGDCSGVCGGLHSLEVVDAGDEAGRDALQK